MKRKFFLFFSLFLFSLCISCNETIKIDTIPDPNFEVKLLSDYNVAIGDGNHNNRREYCYFPEYIQMLKVVQLGYTENGYYNKDNSSVLTETFYCPSSIKKITMGFLNNTKDYINVMYSGEVLDLKTIKTRGNATFYVSKDRYNEFYKLYSGNKDDLRIANLIYDYNYGNRDCYYVDYIEKGCRVKSIPNAPYREGYDFCGWYYEKSVTLESLIIRLENEVFDIAQGQEIRLYAFWNKRN